jgi:hypothetical protein
MRRQVTAVRQGDVLLVPIAPRKSGRPTRAIAPVNGRYILAEGEVTGHHHSVPARANIAFETDGIDAFLTVQQRATALAHQEHSSLTLAPSDYDVILQRRALPGSEQKVMRVYD